MDKKPDPSITCPNCGRTSYNPHDVEEKYCAWCHRFHTEPGAEEVVSIPLLGKVD